MNKNELLKALDEGRENFLEAIENLDDEHLHLPGVTGEWSVKDLLAHLSRWESELVKLLWQLGQGQRPTTVQFSHEGMDAINARWQDAAHERPLEQVLEDFHAVRTQTIRRVEDFSDQELGLPGRYRWLKGKALWEWVASDSFEHENEHAAEIRAWRQRMGL